MKKFIILSTQRSGSAFLATSLASHPLITCHREIFLQKNRNCDSYQMYRSSSLGRRVTDIFNRGSLVDKYLQGIFSADSHVSAAGFKLMYSQAKRFPEVTNWLLENNVHIIHLIRKNYLRTILSACIAQARGIHHSSKTLEKTKVIIHPEMAMREMKKISDNINSYCSLFRNNPYIEISYESFVSDRDAQAKLILEFLAINNFSRLTSELVKNNPYPISELIQNYEEVSDALRGTQFDSFLD
ncbi:sulfotransferase family protein [Thiogranum longum]|uniref:Sulfotransferase family protein n=1 Tax=Thiogranum longum TaxID=1537524 RepID=A0A4R1HQ71_9GAMM|nr:sulfotransferase [Thiogranum longum]TCK19462.1 sulfotransferase family protein [Thiogranum longum]